MCRHDLGVGDRAMNKTDGVSALGEFSVLVEKTDQK